MSSESRIGLQFVPVATNELARTPLSDLHQAEALSHTGTGIFTETVNNGEANIPLWFARALEFRGQARQAEAALLSRAEKEQSGEYATLFSTPESSATAPLSLPEVSRNASERIISFWDQTKLWDQLGEVYPELKANQAVLDSEGKVDKQFRAKIIAKKFVFDISFAIFAV